MIKVRITLQGEGIENVNPNIVPTCEEAVEILVNKNTERGDCWKATGVLGAFVEIHSIYNRLREMIWNRTMKLEDQAWKNELLNCTQDLRNFTILMELAVAAKLPYGDDSIEKNLPPYNPKG